MALDVNYSGFYRVRGFCLHDYATFGRDDGPYGNEHSSDYLDMLLGVQIVFKVHPRLKLVTNFTALDKVWGENDIDAPGAAPANSEDTNNIDWNQAYIEMDTGIGHFYVGRMFFGAFNHLFLDDDTEADAIRYVLNPRVWGGPRWNPLYFTLTYAKLDEQDYVTTLSDEDIDQYRVTLGYFSDNLIIDNMIRFERHESNLFPATLIDIDKMDTWLYNFYAMLKFGIISIEGEFGYVHGYITDPNYYDNNIASFTGETEDIEIDAMAWLLETRLNLDRADFYAGWAHTDGDKDGIKDYYTPGSTINAIPGQFGDFDVLFFLTGTEGMIAENFGGMGNWSVNGDNPHGLDLLYVGGDVDITRDIRLSAVWGIGWADAVPTGSKKVGWEADLAVTWQIMNGLQYKALFAFFDAGDFWEDAQDYYWDNPYDTPVTNAVEHSFADDGHCWALMHQLTLSF